jgi:hypothetical protein
MRLSWPFRRQSEPTSDRDSGSPGDARVAEPSTSVPRPGAADGWASLPPIDRVIADPPLVAPTRSFLADAPGVRPMPPIVEPLGHDVSRMAPAGLVIAPVHAVPTLTSRVDLVPRPGAQGRGQVQRSAIDAHSETTVGAAATAARPTTDEGSVAATLARGIEDGPSPADELERAGRPTRHLGIVPANSVARPPDRPLTTASVQTDRQAGAAARPSVARSAHGPASMPGVPLPRASSPGTAAQATRPGFGAPLASTPPTAVRSSGGGHGMRAVSRETATSTSLIHRATADGVSADRPDPLQGRRPGPSGTIPTDTSDLAAGLQVSAVASSALTDSVAHPTRSPRGLPILRVARERDRAQVGQTPLDPVATERSTASVGHDGERSQGEDRSPGTSAMTVSVATSIRPSQSGPSELRWVERTTAPSRPLVGQRSMTSTPVRAMTDETSVAAGDRVPSPVGDLSGPFSALAIPMIGATPDLVTGSTQASWSDRPPGTRSSVVRDTSLAPRPPLVARASLPTPMARPTDATVPTIARSIVADTGASGSGVTSAPSGARAGQADVQATLGPTMQAIVQRVDGAAPPAPSEQTGGQSDDELDELARALFGRLRDRLRREYIYDREAKGLTFDNT